MISETAAERRVAVARCWTNSGTMFSPIKDRDAAGGGFTHHAGDRVSISTPSLGALVNTVGRSDEITPWTFGVRALSRNLAQRGLLAAGHGA